jgi:hypothetical protein
MPILGFLLLACAGGAPSVRPEQLRAELRAALDKPISTRDQRDEQSRLMARVVEQDAFDDFNRGDVRAALGKGRACRIELCGEQGFVGSDWYYEIGVAQSEDIKQLPVLIFGFDPRDRVARVWTLTTH